MAQPRCGLIGIAQMMRKNETALDRHADPCDVYSRMAVLSLMTLTVWSRRRQPLAACRHCAAARFHAQLRRVIRRMARFRRENPAPGHKSKVAKTGAWSLGFSQPRASRRIRLEWPAPAISGVAQT